MSQFKIYAIFHCRKQKSISFLSFNSLSLDLLMLQPLTEPWLFFGAISCVFLLFFLRNGQLLCFGQYLCVWGNKILEITQSNDGASWWVKSTWLSEFFSLRDNALKPKFSPSHTWNRFSRLFFGQSHFTILKPPRKNIICVKMPNGFELVWKRPNV